MREVSEAFDLAGETRVTGHGNLNSCFAVTDLAVASLAVVGHAVRRLYGAMGLSRGEVAVNRRLASLWFARSIAPQGWDLPPIWDAVAGDYPTRDGWIRLHTNLAHHRNAALAVLGVPAERAKVAEVLGCLDGETVEAEIVAAGGCAARMRSRADWQAHPQGLALASEPLVHWQRRHRPRHAGWAATPARPLAGLKVLDLTRVIAGPVATRTLAGLGAHVLRIDPPDWDEPNVVPDVTLGKRCARLDLRLSGARTRFETLLGQADILVHGYRPGALEGLGYGAAQRAALAPGLIEVALCGYGWTGPWAARRGFDSLVQMSAGIAEAGRRWAGKPHPVPLPVQALDHATGYFAAAAAINGLCEALEGTCLCAQLSLARTADLLSRHAQADPGDMALDYRETDFASGSEATPWGAARRLASPLTIGGSGLAWDRPASELGSADPAWG